MSSTTREAGACGGGDDEEAALEQPQAEEEDLLAVLLLRYGDQAVEHEAKGDAFLEKKDYTAALHEFQSSLSNWKSAVEYLENALHRSENEKREKQEADLRLCLLRVSSCRMKIELVQNKLRGGDDEEQEALVQNGKEIPSTTNEQEEDLAALRYRKRVVEHESAVLLSRYRKQAVEHETKGDKYLEKKGYTQALDEFQSSLSSWKAAVEYLEKALLLRSEKEQREKQQADLGSCLLQVSSCHSKIGLVQNNLGDVQEAAQSFQAAAVYSTLSINKEGSNLLADKPEAAASRRREEEVRQAEMEEQRQRREAATAAMGKVLEEVERRQRREAAAAALGKALDEVEQQQRREAVAAVLEEALEEVEQRQRREVVATVLEEVLEEVEERVVEDMELRKRAAATEAAKRIEDEYRRKAEERRRSKAERKRKQEEEEGRYCQDVYCERQALEAWRRRQVEGDGQEMQQGHMSPESIVPADQATAPTHLAAKLTDDLATRESDTGAASNQKSRGRPAFTRPSRSLNDRESRKPLYSRTEAQPTTKDSLDRNELIPAFDRARPTRIADHCDIATMPQPPSDVQASFSAFLSRQSQSRTVSDYGSPQRQQPPPQASDKQVMPSYGATLQFDDDAQGQDSFSSNPDDDMLVENDLQPKTSAISPPDVGPERIGDPIDVGSVHFSDIGDHDFLYGRGDINHTHPGNINFREWMESIKPMYLTAGKSTTKETRLARELVRVWRSSLTPPGRFLACTDKDLNIWKDVGDDEAYKRVLKCIHDSLTEEERLLSNLETLRTDRALPSGVPTGALDRDTTKVPARKRQVAETSSPSSSKVPARKRQVAETSSDSSSSSKPPPKKRRARPKEAPADDPITILTDDVRDFLHSLGITTGDEFLSTPAFNIVNAYVNWREERGLKALKGRGSNARVSKWRSSVREAAKNKRLSEASV